MRDPTLKGKERGLSLLALCHKNRMTGGEGAPRHQEKLKRREVKGVKRKGQRNSKKGSDAGGKTCVDEIPSFMYSPRDQDRHKK